MTTEPRTARQTCTSHCASCNRHFSGLGAFDRHRTEDGCADPESVVYVMGKRAGERQLQIWTEDGSCDKVKGCWVDGKRDHFEEGVVIWQVATTEEQRERMREAFGNAPTTVMRSPSGVLPGADGAVQARLGF